MDLIIPPLRPYVAPLPPAFPELWLTLPIPSERREYAYVLSVSPSCCDRFAAAGMVLDCPTPYADDVARWVREDIEPDVFPFVVSSSIGRADLLRDDLERLLVSKHGQFIRERMMIVLCHAREDLRCIEIVLRLAGQADALTQTLEALDAWVAEDEHGWPAAIDTEDSYRLSEVREEHPDAWWGANPRPALWPDAQDPAEGDEDD
jgi:hypothetical protein